MWDENYHHIAQSERHKCGETLRMGRVGEGDMVIDVGGDRNRTHHFLSDKVLDRLAKHSLLYGSMVKQLVTLEAKARDYDNLVAKLAKIVEKIEE
ncbi:MAG: hypothetical protein DRI87_05620 [Bacteroidetes bacterium]|nr:MAG: hypothetical protein DRI87_05620 [Bacteroidota bacterium]